MSNLKLLPDRHDPQKCSVTLQTKDQLKEYLEENVFAKNIYFFLFGAIESGLQKYQMTREERKWGENPNFALV